jgi:hypothetical protein
VGSESGFPNLYLKFMILPALLMSVIRLDAGSIIPDL